MSKIKTMLAFVALTLCGGAWAKTIAYWDGDIAEGSSKAGWTLSAGLGATINADGTVTTEKKDGGPQNLGLILSRTDDYTSNALTLVFKYSGLDVCAHNVSMAEMVWGNGETMNKHVARIGNNSANCGMSNGSSQLNAANYTIPTAGMMAISMSNSDGMRISFQAEGETSFTDAAWYTGSDVKLGTKFGSMKIGGCDYASSSYHRPGMKIEAVAIVDEVFESGSVYVFPDAPATYAKSSLSAYINETTAQTLIPNATLEDLLNGTVKGKINGGYISSDFKDDVITASYVTRVPADGDIEKVTLQFKVREGNTMSKAVLAECVQDGADVKIKATGAKHTTNARTYGNDATTWTGGGTVVTSATAGGYGIHEITFNVPYDNVKTIRESTTWADAGVAAPEAGKKTIVYVHGGATVTFADDTIPAGIVLASKMENDGIAVAGTIPMLTTDEALTILADTTATIKPGYRGKVVAKGTAQFTGANSTDYHPEIELAGGTLKVTGANTGSGSMQFYKMALSADSTIDAAVNFYTIASQYGRFNFGLNGHMLTKKGTGTYYVYTPTLVGGGAIDVQDGTLTLKDAKLETGATLTISVAAGKTLKFEGSTALLAGTLNLLEGSFQTPTGATLDVVVPEDKVLKTSESNDVTTYWFDDPEETNDAEIDGVKYESLTNAVLYLSGGKTLTLLRDVTLEETLVLDGLVNGTIDLNGHSIVNSGTGDVVSIAYGAVVTITGAGTIVKDGADYAITSRGLTTISAANGTPVVGGIVAAPSPRSKVSFAYGYYPETPVKTKIDWTGCVSNADTPVVSVHDTDEHPYSSVYNLSLNPIQEIDGVMYEAEFGGGFTSETEYVRFFNYLYTVAEVSVDASHVTIPYLFNVATDTETQKKYARIAKAVKSGTMNGKPLFSYTPMPADINFRVVPDAGYQNPKVTANGATVDPAETGYYHITAVETGVAIVVTAEEIPSVPSWIDDTDAAAVAKYTAWASANDVTDPTTAKKEAFAFNCANTDAAIDLEKDAFVITSLELVDGVPQVTAKLVNLAGKDYNVTPVVRGAATVDGSYTLELTDPTARFFRAFIDL